MNNNTHKSIYPKRKTLIHPQPQDEHKVTFNTEYIVLSGKWINFCEVTGTNEWALNEGFGHWNATMTIQQAKEIGLIS